LLVEAFPATAGATRRRPYRPQAHPGLRDRWSAPAILDALRAWSAATGRAPRRRDWSGEDPARASDAQRRWMREHPRWPSSSCVCAHFGSWSAALAAAGLDARCLTFPTTVAERVAAARELAADGAGPAEIAARLGVSRSSVHNYLGARDCPGCGAPLTSPAAVACRECTRHEPAVGRAWTLAEALAAIREWAFEHGRPPTYRGWTPCRERPGRWEAESPRWPSAAAVCAHYAGNPEPWNAALREAGAAGPARRWSDDAIRAALAGFWARAGRAPTAADLAGAAWTGPGRATLRRRFGGVAEAWQALAPIPAAPRGRRRGRVVEPAPRG
jgi:AcrR family transcriptional regulator